MFRRLLKYAALTTAIFLLVFGVASWIVVSKKNDWLLAQIQSAMQESQSGQLKIKSINLKLFRNLPDVTLQMNGIDYYEHYDSVRTSTEKPILHAEELFVALDLIDLINDDLNITEISLSDAEVTIIEYQHGVLNLDRALSSPLKTKPKAVVKKTPPKSSPPAKKSATPRQNPTPKAIPPSPKQSIQINLETIELNDVALTWHSFSSKKQSSIIVQGLETDFEKEQDAVILNLELASHINSLYVNKALLPSGELNIHTSLQFNRKEKQLIIHESEISYNDYKLLVNGTYEHLKNRRLDIQVDASSNDLKLLSSILKPGSVKINVGLQGDIYAHGKIFGELKNQPPQLDFSFGVKHLSLNLPNNLGQFRNVGFEGLFKSGNRADYSQAVFELRNIHGQLPGGNIRGNIRVNNFVDPSLHYQLNTQLKLDGFDQIFKIDFLKDLKGTVSLNANFDGSLKSYATHAMDSSRSSSVKFENISFILTQSKKPVTALSGKIETKNNQSAIQQIKFKYGKSNVLINATVNNLVYLLFNLENEITATGSLQSEQIFTEDFILDSLRSAQIQDKISNLTFGFEIKSVVRKQNDTLTKPEISFHFKNLSANLDKLPDLKSVHTKGILKRTSKGLMLSLESFQAIMPQGTASVTGNLYIPSQKLWQFDAQVKLNKFPLPYVQDLIAEIKDNKEPGSKNTPVEKMELITSEFHVSSSMAYPYDINLLEINDCRLNYELPGKKSIAAENLDITLENMLFNYSKNPDSTFLLRSMRATVSFMQLRLPGIKPFNISTEVTGVGDQLEVSFVSEIQKAKSEKGTLDIDFSQKENIFHLQYFVEGANLEHFIQKYYNRKLMKGNLNYTIDLKTQGKDWTAIQQNINSNFEISGTSLRFYGVDLDKALKKYERSQNFNLTDLGAVLVAGPIGLLATKGTDFVALTSIKLDSSKYTNINTLYTRWKFENEKLYTEDVALATTTNRIAFDGSIDFKRDSIPGITIAVVDKSGCSLMDQKLYGKIGAVKTGKLNITKTLLGSVINFANAVVGKDCKPVYKGSVKAPE